MKKMNYRIGAVVGALLIAVAAPLVLDSHPLQLVTESLVVGVAAMSFVFLYGYAGLASLAQMAYFAVAGYAVAITTMTYNVPFFIAAIAGILTATSVALLFGLIAYRSAGTYFLMMTLALSQLIYSLATQWSNFTGGYRGIAGVPRPQVGTVDFADLTPRYFLFVLLTLIVFVSLTIIVKSEFGLALRGMNENPLKAEALGISVRRRRLVAHVMAGATAGVAGVMGLIQYGVVSPESTGLTEILKVVMAAIIGGTLWLYGGILGALIVVPLISVVSGMTDRYWMIVGTIFVLVVIFMPKGVIGAVRDQLAKVRRMRTPVVEEAWTGSD